jgi:ribosomal-protein-alanine N-acetyltransferase
MIGIRLASIEDAAALSTLYQDNRAFLAPWEPIRDEAFFTAEGQRQRLEAAALERETGIGCRYVIEDDGRIVGMASLTAIERGPVQSAHLGYWVAETVNGRGVATRAVSQVLDLAFGPLDLHRVQAGTLLHNVGSQKVLERNGFERIGIARAYLRIAGEWQDHLLFQRIAG